MRQHSECGIVSVILPAYNAEAHLRATIESVLAQTYPHIEVIIVSDGSTDGTDSIIQEYAGVDRRIRFIRQQNRGVGAARNVAIRAARGAYIAPIDADDVWLPRKLERQVARIEERGVGTGMVYCWSRRINASNELVGYGHCFHVEGHASRAMLLRNVVENGSVPLFRASALDEVGLYLTRDEQNGAQGFEDWDLTLRVAEKYEIGAVGDYLVDYRVRAESMSSRTDSMAASFEIVIDRARRRNPHVRAREFRWSRGHFYAYLMGRSESRRGPAASVEFLTRSVIADPAVLLSQRTYRVLGRTAWKALGASRIVTRPRGPRSHRAGEKSSPANAHRTGQGIFGRIQARRWTRALYE